MRATVHPQSAPGHAILRITELEAQPDGLAVSIQRQQGPDSHLADDGLATVHLDLGDEGLAEEFMQKAQAVCERAGLEPDALVVLPFLD